MKLFGITLLGVEILAAIALSVAALAGDTTLVPGLQVRNLAYDNIAFAIMAVGLVSCALAAILLVSLARSWHRMHIAAFVIASILAWLSASAFENAHGLTFNGASRHWFSWPVACWLLVMWAGYVALAVKSHRKTA